jgi:hypothetical protein
MITSIDNNITDNITDNTNASRLRLVPAISRARDFRFYTSGGRRFIDLWQYGGRAVLGHTPPSVLREMKNTAERGLFAPLPGPHEGRFLKALSALLPGRVFRLFPDDAALSLFLEASGFSACARDPALAWADVSPEEPAPPHPLLWRPFLEDPAPQPLPQAAPLIPVLPLPWAGAPRVLALDPADTATASKADADGPLSPVILAAASRAVYDLIAALDRGRPLFPKIDRAVRQSGLWQRRGVYVSLSTPPNSAAYTVLFRRFLEAGCLLPPGPGDPAILPGVLSPGEEAKLAVLFAG